MKRRSNIIHNERGSLFVISYMLITVFIVLGAGFVMLSTIEARSSERQRRVYQAFHIAEAGIERAIYDLRQDFINDTTPSWSDGDIHAMAIGPDTGNFYTVPYGGTALNGGAYTVQFKNVAGNTRELWVRSSGTVGDITQTLQVYARIVNLSPWNNAIFAGAGASGQMVNGNVNIRGSVHILGTGLTSTDYAIDLGGTAELVGNNYNSLEAGLLAKVPALPTTVVGGETVSTLNASLRVKHGRVGLSGSSSVGEANVTGNGNKENVDGTYVTDGFGGSQGTTNVHSDNGWSNGYDLGDSVAFPSMSDPYGGYSTYSDYLRANALVLDSAAQLTQMASITPASSFTYSSGAGSISMDGSGNLTVSGIVYIDGGDLNFLKTGSNKTITYTGTGSIYTTGNAQINVNLVTAGNNSFPSNIIGIMTPNSIGFDEANINVMGLFYGEDSIVVAKQTDLVGTIVSNYFDVGTNVPSVFQVPETVNYLPPGMIGQEGAWAMQIVSWEKI